MRRCRVAPGHSARARARCCSALSPSLLQRPRQFADEDAQRRVVRWKGSAVGLEEIAILRASSLLHLPLKRRGFSKRVSHVAKHLVGCGDVDLAAEFCNNLDRLTPDASYLDCDAGMLHVLEVEDTSRLTEKKLDLYLEAWFDLDSSMSRFDISLYVSDRYGDAKTLPLRDMWMFRESVVTEQRDPSDAGRAMHRRFRSALTEMASVYGKPEDVE